MKIALITDTHWGARNDSPAFADYFNRFYYEQFFPYLKENGINQIIHLGDFVDRRKYINFVTARHVNQFVQTCIENEIYLDILVGNHDTFFKNTNEVNAVHELLQYADSNWIEYYSGPTEKSFDDLKIAMLPWVCSGNYEESMAFLNNTRAQVLFGHLEIQGFEMYRGSVNDHGFSPELFAKFDMVCSGHFHHKSSRENINYLGSPYEITWSDFNDHRGFHVFDTQTRSLRYIVNPLLMFRKLYYDDTYLTIEEMISELDELGEDLKNNYIKVLVRKRTNPVSFDKYIDKLDKMGLSDLQIIEDNVTLAMEDGEESLEEAEDTVSILSKVVETLETNVDKTKLSTFLKSLYDESVALE